MKAFSVQEASLIEHIRKNLSELIGRTAKGCSMGDRPRILCANVSSRAKWLLSALDKLESGEMPLTNAQREAAEDELFSQKRKV